MSTIKVEKPGLNPHSEPSAPLSFFFFFSFVFISRCVVSEMKWLILVGLLAAAAFAEEVAEVEVEENAQVGLTTW